MTTRSRLIIGALSGVVVVLVVLLIWSFTRPAQQQTTTPPPSPVASAPTATPSFNESAGDADNHDHASDDDANEAAWRPVVENFGRNFPNTAGGAAKWRARLIGDPQKPYVTAEVTKQLGTVDVTRVPKGRYDSYEALKTSAYEVAVKVTYREGWALVLYLITDGTAWQVYAYDKWEQ
jgi:hypothetical protein